MVKVRCRWWLSVFSTESQETLCQSSKWHKAPSQTTQMPYTT